MSIIQLLYAALIGLIQGISEWLPISSKTQIIVSSHYLLNLSIPVGYTFGLFMEIGTLAAAIIYFRKDLAKLVHVLAGSRDPMKRKLFAYVLVVTVITGLIAVPLFLVVEHFIGSGNADTGIAVGIPMLVLGLVLLGDAALIRYSRKKMSQGMSFRKLENLSVKDYILVGITQGISVLPGVSRSGITTSAMLLLGIEPDEAFRLSFTAGIFAALGAFGLTLVASRSNVAASIAGIGTVGLAVAIITSFVISFFLIDFLIKFAAKQKITYLTAGLGITAIAISLLYLVFGV